MQGATLAGTDVYTGEEQEVQTCPMCLNEEVE